MGLKGTLTIGNMDRSGFPGIYQVNVDLQGLGSLTETESMTVLMWQEKSHRILAPN